MPRMTGLQGAPELSRRRPALKADTLTPRELQVLKLIAEAYTSDLIAVELSISRRTVDHHRENILAKLVMRDRVELTRYGSGAALSIPDDTGGAYRPGLGTNPHWRRRRRR